MLDLSPAPGDLEPIETASRDEITTLQLQRLRWTLRHAYENVPFYRRRMDACGLHPQSVRSADDLRSLPPTTKHDIAANFPDGITDHSQSLKIAGGVSEADLWKQIRKIDALNARRHVGCTFGKSIRRASAP